METLPVVSPLTTQDELETKRKFQEEIDAKKKKAFAELKLIIQAKMKKRADEENRSKEIFQPRSVLAVHEVNYLKSVDKLKARDKDVNMINKTIEWLKKYPIKCFRYSNKLGCELHIPEKYNA